MEEDLESDDDSVDSVEIDEVLEWILDDERLCYLCRSTDSTEEIFDRSDLMDEGPNQRMVMAHDRKYPPPWDDVCRYCDGDGCEECVCDICERACRHIGGVNYGCVKHPVV